MNAKNWLFFSIRFGNIFNALLEHISQALCFLALEALHEGGQVCDPDVAHKGPLEEVHTLLVDLERFLKLVLLLHEVCVVQEQLRGHDLQVDHAVVHILRRL